LARVVARGVTSNPPRIPTPTEEALLVARAARRDSAAYLRLYEAYLDRIYRHIYYRVNSTSEAEGLTEQVFLTAWEAINRDERRGTPFGTWLYRLAQTLLIGHHRAQAVTLQLDDAAETEFDEAHVVGAVKGVVMAAEVRTALVVLIPEHQQVIVLRFVEGLSHAEVSQIIGKSEDATHLIQHRALQALGRTLASRGIT
jgi:RNA polymerase sigma-70 factor (ECF subfamily)